MQEGKLIKLLKALTKEEFRNLEDYMDSPFFLKRNKDALLLYKAIKRQYPHFQSSVLLKRRVFKKVYPDQEYADGKMRNLLTKVVKIIESYLLYLDDEGNKIAKNKQLMTIYEKRNVYEEFTRSLKNLRKQLEKNPFKDANYFFQLYSLDKYLYFNVNTPKTDKTVDILKNSLENLHHYFVLERINFGMDLKNRETIYKKKYSFQIDDFSKIIPEDNVVYKLYKALFQLLEDKNSTTFLELNTLFKKHLDQINIKDKSIIFIILQNFLGRQLAQDEELFAPIAFEHFKIGLEEKILIINGTLNPTIYLNIVSISSKLKKFKWTYSFIKKYVAFLPKNSKELTKNLAISYLEFNKENHLKVIDVLNKINKEKNIYTQKINNLSIRTYFKLFQQEKSYFELLLSQCNAFERWLQRDGIKAERKIQPNIKFVKLVKKIASYINKDTWSINIEEELLAYINYNAITLKGWLIIEVKLIGKLSRV